MSIEIDRTTGDQYLNGTLYNGYDYNRQAWVSEGRYQSCGHKAGAGACWACDHAGEAYDGDQHCTTEEEIRGMIASGYLQAA